LSEPVKNPTSIDGTESNPKQRTNEGKNHTKLAVNKRGQKSHKTGGGEDRYINSTGTKYPRRAKLLKTLTKSIDSFFPTPATTGIQALCLHYIHQAK
jgi:hypothetical protein